MPLTLVQLAQVAISTTDIVMLGWLGGEALAAGALGFFCFNLLRTMGFGLLVGLSNLVAAEPGGTLPRAHLVAGLVVATIAAVMAGALLALGGPLLPRLGQESGVSALAAHYLLYIAPGYLPLFCFYAYRGVVVGRRRSGALLAITLATILVNAGLDYGFIYGAFGLPALGAPGVALASSVAYLAQFLAIAAVTHAQFAFSHGGSVAAALRRLLRIGVPTAGAYGSEAGFTMVLGLMVGTFGAAALAGHAIVNQVTYVVFMLSVGLSHATSVGVSEAVGGHVPAGVLRAGRSGLLLVAIAMAAFSLLWLIVPDRVVALFAIEGQDAGAVTLVALSLLPVAAAMQVFDGVQNVAIGALRGIHRAGLGFWITLCGYWVVGIPVAALLGPVAQGGPVGVWIGMAIGLAVTAAGMVAAFERDAARAGA